MLKTDLHIHTKSFISWEGNITPKELIDRAAKLGFDVLSITEHATLNKYFSKTKFFDALRTYRRYKDYAKKKGILLISGFEAHIEGKEVLFFDCYEDISKYRTFDSLYKLKDNCFIVAPHPFLFKDSCLKGKLIEHIKLFDAVEHTSSYLNWFNSNLKTEEVVKKYNKPFIANSDSHWWFQFGRNYSVVDAEKNKDDLFEAIRKKKLRMVVDPLKFYEAVFFAARFPYTHLRKEFE